MVREEARSSGVGHRGCCGVFFGQRVREGVPSRRWWARRYPAPVERVDAVFGGRIVAGRTEIGDGGTVCQGTESVPEASDRYTARRSMSSSSTVS